MRPWRTYVKSVFSGGLQHAHILSDKSMVMVGHGHNPRESLGSLMSMLHPISRWNMVPPLPHHMVTPHMMMVILIIRTRVVVVLRLRNLSLRVFFIFHSSVLEPDLHLSFGEV